MVVLPGRSAHTEGVDALSLDTWISLAVLVTALSGFYVALRREFRRELRSEVARLEAHIIRLSDRVFALASALAKASDDQPR